MAPAAITRRKICRLNLPSSPPARLWKPSPPISPAPTQCSFRGNEICCAFQKTEDRRQRSEDRGQLRSSNFSAALQYEQDNQDARDDRSDGDHCFLNREVAQKNGLL